MQLGPRKIYDSHVCVDCFQASEFGGWAFEVQWGFVGSHWQDNMVQRFHICRSRDLFFFCVLEFFWKWLSARAWGCIDLFYPVESHRNNYSKQLATLTFCEEHKNSQMPQKI